MIYISTESMASLEETIIDFKKITDFILSHNIDIELFENSETHVSYIRFYYKGQKINISLKDTYILTIDEKYYLADCDSAHVIDFLKNLFDGNKPKRSFEAMMLENMIYHM